MADIKQIIVMRTDLNMRKGKMIAQGSHASMKVLLDRRLDWSGTNLDDIALRLNRDMLAWVNGAFTKIVVGIESEEAFLALLEQAKAAGLPCAAIQDNGATEFHGQKTWTALAIGPALSEEIDKITGHLKLL